MVYFLELNTRIRVLTKMSTVITFKLIYKLPGYFFKRQSA